MGCLERWPFFVIYLHIGSSMPNSSAFFQGKINPHFKIFANQSDSANDNNISLVKIQQLHWSAILFRTKQARCLMLRLASPPKLWAKTHTSIWHIKKLRLKPSDFFLANCHCGQIFQMAPDIYRGSLRKNFHQTKPML